VIEARACFLRDRPLLSAGFYGGGRLGRMGAGPTLSDLNIADGRVRRRSRCATRKVPGNNLGCTCFPSRAARCRCSSGASLRGITALPSQGYQWIGCRQEAATRQEALTTRPSLYAIERTASLKAPAWRQRSSDRPVAPAGSTRGCRHDAAAEGRRNPQPAAAPSSTGRGRLERRW